MELAPMVKALVDFLLLLLLTCKFVAHEKISNKYGDLVIDMKFASNLI